MFKRAHTSYRKAYIITACLSVIFILGFLTLSGKLPKSKSLQQSEIEALEQVKMGKFPSDSIDTVGKKQMHAPKRELLGDFGDAREAALHSGGGSHRHAHQARHLKSPKGKETGDETDEAREAAEAPAAANARRSESVGGPKTRRGTAKRLGLAADDTAGAKEHAAEEHADDEEHAAHVDANLRARLKNAASQKD